MSYQEEQDFTNARVDLKLWKRLYAYAWRNKKIFLMTIACLLFVALVDSLYPLLANYAVDRFIIPGKSDGTWLFLVVYVVLAFSQGFGTLGFITRCGRMEMNIAYDIRQDGFLKLQNQSFSYYDKTAVGYLMARMISDVSRLSEMVAWSMVDLLWSSCYAVLCLIIMLLKNWKLALLVLLVVPPLAVAALFLERAILKYQREARKHNSRITGAFNEGIMGAMTTKTLVYEEENAKEFREITQSMRKASIKAALINAIFFPLVISLGAIGTSLALFLGGKGVLDPEHAFIGPISAGTLVAFVTYAASLFDPIQQIASIFADFQSAQASAERVIGLIDAPIEVQDRTEVVEKYHFELNSNARHLKKQSKDGIAIIIKGTNNMLFAAIVEHLQRMIRDRKYACMVYYIGEDDNEVEQAIRICQDRNPYGILFLGCNKDHFRAKFSVIPIPCVLVTSTAEDLGFDNLSSVGTDDVEGARYAVNHLFSLGHQKIGILGGNRMQSQAVADRYLGIIKAFEDHQMEFFPEIQYEMGHFSLADGYSSAKRLIQKMPERKMK